MTGLPQGDSATRVLVVDDDEPSRRVVRETLQREGYDVAMAHGADSALAAHAQAAFDVVVSDIHMPGMDGLELLAALRDDPVPPLVVLITAFGDMEGAARALQGGAFEYLSKPFRPAELAQLLRVLQEGEVRPVGSTKTTQIDTRVVAATNRDLPEMVREGSFREDLWYRIMVVVLDVPPLRDRREDVPLLVQHFLHKYGAGQKRQIDVETLQALVGFDWPGNVRQLENTIARALALTPGERITRDDLPSEIRSDSVASDSAAPAAKRGDTEIQTLSEVTRRYSLEVLELCGGNKSKAAELLGIDRKTLYRLVKSLEDASEA